MATPTRALSPNKPPSGVPVRTTPRSRTRSRPRNSRQSSRASIAYLPQDPASLVLPEGGIGEEATELLQDFVYSRHHDENTLFGDEEPDEGGSDAASLEIRNKLPWYKRPSPLWFLIVVPFASAATAATAAPRVELFTQLACAVHKPEYNETMSLVSSVTSAAVSFMADEDKRLCASDPVVQAAVAKLTLAMTLSVGVLSCFTTAWWGSLSDRYGRVRIMSFAVFGLLATDVNFLATVKYHKYLPGGYWFILVGPLLDGAFGGLATVSATIHAYLADCTDSGSRSHVFSLFLGLMFVGFGLGPTLGSIIIHATGSVLSVFYVAACMHLFYASMVWFVVPESLSIRRQHDARKARREEIEEASRMPKQRGVLAAFKKVFGFMSPLTLFYPVETVGKDGKKHKDWNLLLAALAYGSTATLMGSYSFKFQYAAATFGWSSEELGYWLSSVGATRAIYLTAILPVIIRYLKPKPKQPIQLPNASRESLVLPEDPESGPVESATGHVAHSARSLPFDLSLARSSIFVEVFSYTALAFARNGTQYTVFSMLGALGAGFSPAVQSVALGLYTLRGGTESGKLFGAMSVMQSLCQSIIGPSLFGFTYVKTVAFFPTAIFFVAAGAVTLSMLVLTLVRLPKDGVAPVYVSIPSDSTATHNQDATLVDPEVPLIIVEDVGKTASTSSSPVL